MSRASYLLATGPAWGTPQARWWASSAPPARILLIDDDPSLSSLIRILLEASGYEVVMAADGESGLSLAAESDFDVILLDLEMPVMNGRDFFREIRARGNTTPIVIVSAYGAESARMELGAQAAINKPFDPYRLARIVETLLNRPA